MYLFKTIFLNITNNSIIYYLHSNKNIIFIINSSCCLRIDVQKLVIFFFISLNLKCYFQVLDLSINENLIMDGDYTKNFHVFLYTTMASQEQ